MADEKPQAADVAADPTETPVTDSTPESSTPETSNTGSVAEDLAAVLNRPDVQKHVQGLIKNRDDILAEKRETEQQNKQMQKELGMLEKLGGEEALNRLVALQKQLEDDEMMKEFAKGNEAGYRERVTRALKADMQRQLDDRDVRLKEAQEQLTQREHQMREMLLDSKADRMIARTSGIISKAIPMVKLMVKQKFSIDPETGKEVARDDQGNLEIGPQGKPLTMDDWFATTLREEAPYVFQGQSGIGASATAQTGNGRAQLKVTREQLMDPATYQRLKEEFTKRGEPWPPVGGFNLGG